MNIQFLRLNNYELKGKILRRFMYLRKIFSLCKNIMSIILLISNSDEIIAWNYYINDRSHIELFRLQREMSLLMDDLILF